MGETEDGQTKEFAAEEILIATGRQPNIEGLELERAGVRYTKRGIEVDQTMRTSRKNIWACGDVAGTFPFTHMAEHEGGIVIGNALLPFVRRKRDDRVVPWCTFTDPPLARVGMTEEEAKEKYGDSVKVYRYPFEDQDRAIIEGETKGMIKLIATKNGKILGAHILGGNAGELIHEYVLAMKHGLSIGKISQTVHIYPTLSQAVKRTTDQYYAEKLFSGWLPKLVKNWLSLTR